MNYCRYHEIHYSGRDCPRCLSDARHEELVDLAREQHEEALETISSFIQESQDRRANPGDYRCPHCGYKTLLYRADRCPNCQGTVKGDYWEAVAAAEREEKERRSVAAQEEKAKRVRERAENEEKLVQYSREHPYTRLPLRVREATLVVYDFYLLPMLASLSTLLVRQWIPTLRLHDWSEMDFGWTFYPVLNWLRCLGGIVGSVDTILMLNSFVAWVFIGKLLRDRSFNPYGPESRIYGSDNSPIPSTRTVRENNLFMARRNGVWGWARWNWRVVLLGIAIVANVVALLP
jgi:hypothetical protein